MNLRKINAKDIQWVYEKDLYIGASCIVLSIDGVINYISPLLFRMCLKKKTGCITSNRMFEIGYDTLVYIAEQIGLLKV